MDFVSSITLKFNDLFSSGFSQAGQSLGGFKDSLNDIGDSAPKAGMFDAGLAQMQSGLDKIGQNSSLNMVATQLSTMAYMTAPVQKALAGMMGEPSRLAGTFESSMKNIQAITGLTSAEIASLGDELLSIGGRVAAGPQAVADAYNDVAGGITRVEAQMPVLNNALALAEAGQADLGVAANGLVKIMNAYNFTVGEAAEIDERAAWASDVMTQAVGMGVGSMQEFISAMAPISGMASSVGVGFDEIGSTMAYMTASTDTAATAGTKLQSFMVALQKPSDGLAAALKSMGITSGSAMLAQYGLAESANIVMQAFDGNQDAMTAAMGRVEAMQAVVSLTGNTYTDFATEFGASMDGITAKSQAIQTESYESKMARFQAATDALKISVGDDINAVKGFFVDMGTGFLTGVAPIMNSPVGGVFQRIAAITGIGVQGVLSFGSGALNTAAQLSVLAANVKNFSGYADMFKGALSIMGAPLKAAMSGFLGLAGSIWAAIVPALPFIAIGLAIAFLAYHIFQSWDPAKGFFENIFNGIWQAVQTVWEKIKQFWNWFTGLFGGGDKSIDVNAGVSSDIKSDIASDTNPLGNQPGIGGFDLGGLTGQLKESLGTNLTPATTKSATSNLASYDAMTRASAPELTHTASSAFQAALSASPGAAGIDMSAFERQVDMRLQDAVIPQAPALATPWQQTASQAKKSPGPTSVTIQNLTVQAEDMENALDFVRVLMNSVHKPEAAAV